jgi:site-specific recombinase XerD
MNTWKLCSSLARPMESFLALRRLSGTDYRGQALLLGYFDRFLVEAQLNPLRLTREITDRYQETLVGLAPGTQNNRMCVIKQFSEYLARIDAASYVTESRGPSSLTAHTPYIFSLSQVQALLKAASLLSPAGSLRPQTYVTLLGLLYSTGIRISEACALRLENFFAAERRLYIAAGKFHKARWVALSGSSCRALQRYVEQRLRKHPCAPDAPLFLNECRRSLHHPTVIYAFHNLLQDVGIPHHRDTGPRIHDMRYVLSFIMFLVFLPTFTSAFHLLS